MNARMPYDPKRIATLILKHKKATGLSWRALAEHVDCSSGTLRAIANGDTRAMRLDTAYRLAAAMGLEVWELIGDEPRDVTKARALMQRLRGALAASRQAAQARSALEAELADLEQDLSTEKRSP